MTASKVGFTLIELLIVAVIVGVLAAVAVPNYLNASIRSKVAKVHADHQALSNAIKMYQLDRADFPPAPIFAGKRAYDFAERWQRLTTPVSYINQIPKDYFPHRSWYEFDQTDDLRYSMPGAWAYGYFRSDYSGPNGIYNFGADKWMISSSGPDGYIHYLGYFPETATQAEQLCTLCSIDMPYIQLQAISYSPSNGIISLGEIIRWSHK